eukprot:Phypoly_transcript_08451.p1 GENE.Phypoly_transcript_08451~~Phypoly_transcript_08451.p1  ORF type:complete len:246 (+),score=39.85 Phypoly_transcript_08451:743-1480(+)
MRPYFLLFGDSITQNAFSVELRGWGSLLADHYTAKVDVINRGFSGYTTRIACLLLDKVLPVDTHSSHSVLASSPSLVTIFFGANDASQLPSTQHVPIDEFAENLRKIVDHAKRSCPNIVLITCPPFEQSMWRIFCEANQKPNNPECRTNEVAGTYAARLLEVAKEKGVHSIDLWNEMQKEADWRSFLVDGLHLSSEGNAFLYHSLRKLINEKMPEISAEKLPIYNHEGIHWSDIDMQNPRNSIKP